MRTHHTRFRPAWIASVLVIVALLLGTSLATGIALASPVQPAGRVAEAETSLGGGTYRVTASVFGAGGDGQVGTQTSSGHWITENDNLVALPACVESSCPWYSTSNGVGGTYGPNEACAEADGQCWVKVVSDQTGKCTVAPVLERGPLFIKDNWWAPTNKRTYAYPQGNPAAEYARDGANLGYGAGISDVGLNIQRVYTYAAGIDLAAGTWQAIGLPVAAGVSTVTVTMLWQAGITHTSACSGGSSTATPVASATPVTTAGANATTTTSLNLRSSASTSASVIAVMPSGSRVKVTGALSNGFYPVTWGTKSGWASASYLTLDAAPTATPTTPAPTATPAPSGASAKTTSSVNLRSGPSTSFPIVLTIPAGATVQLTGQVQSGFTGVTYSGRSGWVSSQFLATGSTSTVPATATPKPTQPGSLPADGNAGTARTTANVNLRSAANTSASVILVIPSGSTVTLTGATSNGFSGVKYNGSLGWVATAFLAQGATTTPTATAGSVNPGVGNGETATTTSRVNLRSGPGTSYAIVLTIPLGATVQLTGQVQSGFTGVVYNGSAGWVSSSYLATVSTASVGEVGDTLTVFDGTLNLRSGPGTSYGVLLTLPDGAVVEVIGAAQDGFANVRYGGTDGWASLDYLK